MYVLNNVFFQYGENTILNIGAPNAILFKNTGTNTAYVNGFAIAPNEVFTSNLLLPSMVDNTKYQITFDPNGTGTNLMNIIASYVSEQKLVINGPAC